MKTPKILLIFALLILNSCSSDDSSDSSTPTSKFAMTAKVDGVLWEMQNPFNSNFATDPLFDYYPEEDFIQLQGRNGGIFGIDEIRLLIKRSDLKIGTYPIVVDTYGVTQIEVSLNSKENTQYVVEGTLTITSVDLNAKKVAGTFSFNCAEESEPISASNPITTRVTAGTFNYKYDFDYKK
ncbi:MAG TPA: hypothetical protein VF465_12560 [Flavobacterium sp.]|uniref:hypothetical protein n=1 Tax=Flavobacterium sp. TaxID=239 RepID=UPI0028E62888|nr:hypothetical protein [uncultured Flavobacterium sp.]